MCPITTDEDLALLASGEMNRFRARQLTKHIAECGACRAAWTETQQLWQNASASVEETPGVMLYERIQHQITAVPKTSAKTHRRDPASRRLVIGIAAASTLIAFSLLPRTPEDTRKTRGSAFAQVEAAMAKIDTVTWRETVDQQLMLRPDGSFSARAMPRAYVLWARLQNPALVQLRGTQSRTVTFSSEAYLIFSQKGGLYCSRSPSGIQTPEVFETQKGQTSEARLRSAIIFSQNEPELTAAGGSTGTRPEPERIKRTPWVQKRSVLEGKDLLRFDRILSYTPEPSGKSSMMQMDRQVWTFWIEPQTSRIVRREVVTRYANARTSVETRQVSDRFQYNLTPPAGLFEVTPPVGRRYSFVPLPQRRATEEEQNRIGAAIRNAVAAWNTKNQRKFAAAWDFDYEVATKRQNDNRRRVILRSVSQVLNGRVSLKSVGGAFSRISGVYTKHRASDPFPPKEPNEFVVSASVHVEGKAESKTERLLLNMSRQSDGSFKIIRWKVMRLDPH